MRANLLCLSVVAGLSPVASLAQEAGGVWLNFGISQRLDITSNRDLSDTVTTAGRDATTSLSFGITSETRSESLALNLGADVRFSNDASTTYDPTASLSYTRSTEDASLSINASWAQSDISFLQDAVLVDGQIPDDFTDLFGTGTRTTRNASAVFQWGETDPVGYQVGLEIADIDYANANTSLVDSRRTTLTGGLRLDIDPVTTANISLRYSRREPDGSDIENTASLTSSLIFSRPRGDITAGLTAARDNAGTVRFSTNLGRSFSLPNSTFAADIGLSENAAGNAALTGQLAYQYALPTSQLNFSARRSVGREITTDTLNAAFAKEVSPISNIQVGYDYTRVQDSDTNDDLAIKSLSISYGHSLTNDWQLNLGVRNDQRDNSGVKTHANSVFLVVDRDFTFRR